MNKKSERQSEVDRKGEVRRRSPAILLAIMTGSAIWLLAMSSSIWRSEVPNPGAKAAVLLTIAGLFLGGWLVALRWRFGKPRA